MNVNTKILKEKDLVLSYKLPQTHRCRCIDIHGDVKCKQLIFFFNIIINTFKLILRILYIF